MFSSNLGFIHTLFAVGAIVFGAIVILTKKGTPQHKLLGYAYFATMALMNLTALFTQSLYEFGLFHWLAIASLLTVSAGIAVPLFFRNHRNWLLIHFDLMLWSYLGLIAALFAEIAVRLPVLEQITGGDSLFWLLVICSSMLTFLVGGYLIKKQKRHFFK